jgi:NodT family efflux transporter outer membrane factor (OMF) lipoprotein
MSVPTYPTSFRRACLAALLLGLAGCASFTRTQYVAPQTGMPSAWHHASPAGATPDAWWQSYGDEQLNALIAEALARNADLATAAIRIRIARLNLGLQGEAMMPALSASAGSLASKSLKGNDGTLTRSHSVSASLSWEVDLWGRLASARDAAQWELQATMQDRQSAALALVGDVARNYWQIAFLNERIRLSDASIAYAEKTVALAHIRYQAGAVSRIDLLQAEQSLASQRAAHSAYLGELEQARTTLALLLGGPPSKNISEAQTLPAGELPIVEGGLPASLLSRRPDLQAAELRLRESLATADNSRLAYYPDLTLTGTAGSASERLRKVLDNPVGSLAAGLTLPFLQYSEMHLRTGVSRAEYELAVVQYRQALYAALGDVENALSARQQYITQGGHIALSLDRAEAAEKINETRYRSGSIPMQTWLDSQETLRSAQASMLQNRYDQLGAQITLNLSLGGGTKALAGQQKAG